MIYVIMNSSVNWSGRKPGPMVRGAVYTTSAAITGVIAGSAAGLIGQLSDPALRIACAAAVAVLGTGLGIYEALGGRRIVQWNRETPKRWIHSSWLTGSIKNGIAMGLGVRTRIGLWLWFVIPVSSILLGDPILGMIVWGGYGLGRGIAPWLLIGHDRWAARTGHATAMEVLPTQYLAVRKVTGVVLVALCVGVTARVLG